MFAIDSESSNQRLAQLEDSNLEYSNQGSSFSLDTSNQGSVSMETSFLAVNRTDLLSLNENSNQDSIATDQYQDMEGDIKGKLCTIEPCHEKICLLPYVNNKDANQPAHPCLCSVDPVILHNATFW